MFICLFKIYLFIYYLDEETNSCTLAEIILASVKVANIWGFLSPRIGINGIQSRTVVNYSAAFKWHLVYLRYLLHKDALVSDKEQELHTAINSVSGEDCLRWMKESRKKLKTEMRKHAVIAEKQTIQRNNKDALTERGQWFEFDWFRQMHQAIDIEGWGRVDSLKLRLQLTDFPKV